jgi:hypothetical protein
VSESFLTKNVNEARGAKVLELLEVLKNGHAVVLEIGSTVILVLVIIKIAREHWRS